MAKVALGSGPLPTVHQEGKAVAAKACVPKPTDRGTGAKHALSLIAGEGAKQLLYYTVPRACQQREETEECARSKTQVCCGEA